MIDRKRNRRQSRAARGDKFWCGCDRYFGSNVGRCPACGAKTKGMDKKPAPIIEPDDLAPTRSRAATEAAKEAGQ